MNLTTTFSSILEYANYVVHFVWNSWIFYPIVYLLIFPLIICFLVYASALFLHLYKFRYQFWRAYSTGDLFVGAKKAIAAFWDFHGKVWHGYEAIGFEKIPASGPALLIYYHAALPVDIYYLQSKFILYQSRTFASVGDRFLFKIPGIKILLQICNVVAGPIESCASLLESGQLLTIAPGGLRECLLSDNTYKLMWSQRLGFAKLAQLSQVPVFPMFTQNCREAFRTFKFGIFRKLYEVTRLPLVPIYGGFPVKMRTIIGDPIYPQPDDTVAELASKIQDSLEELIRSHQRIPGSILHALFDRFYCLQTQRSEKKPNEQHQLNDSDHLE